MKKEHLLVIRFSNLGDLAMTVPVVWSLAQQYPDIRITVLSRRFARPLFEDLAPNVNFMEADLKREYHGIKGLNALYRRLVAKQFTKVADLQNVMRSEYLRMRFNLGRYRVEHIKKNRNVLEVFERLGYPVDVSSFRSIFPEEGGNLNMLPKEIGPKKSFEHWIGIAPFGTSEANTYPPTLMEQVIFQLFETYPKCRIFFFGKGKNEEKYFKLWCAQYRQCTSLTRHSESLYQELIVMSHLDVMVSMNSANIHLASLTGVPVFQIVPDSFENIPPERIVERIKSIINN